MSTQHKITAIRSGSHPTLGDWDSEYEITFNYVRAAAPIMHPADDADPGWPAEVELCAISPGAGDHGAFSDLAQRDLGEWAEDWLADNIAECIDKAEADLQPDPDDVRDRRLDAEGRR